MTLEHNDFLNGFDNYDKNKNIVTAFFDWLFLKDNPRVYMSLYTFKYDESKRKQIIIDITYTYDMASRTWSSNPEVNVKS